VTVCPSANDAFGQECPLKTFQVVAETIWQRFDGRKVPWEGALDSGPYSLWFCSVSRISFVRHLIVDYLQKKMLLWESEQGDDTLRCKVG